MKIYKKAVGTKLDAAMYAKFEALAAKFGLTRYDLLQLLIATLIRYFDGESEVSEETHNLMRIFEGLRKDPDTFSICLKRQNCKVVSAIYFVKQGKKPVPQPVFVTEDGETYNFDQMAAALFRAYDADLLHDIERAKDELENFSIMQTVREAVKMVAHEDYDLCEDIRQIFDEAQKRAQEREQEFEYTKKYKRAHGYDFELAATGAKSYNELNEQGMPSEYEQGDALPDEYDPSDTTPLL